MSCKRNPRLSPLGWTLILATVAAVGGCSDDSPTRPGGAVTTLASIWPAEVGSYWAFALESRSYDAPGLFDTPADVPPLPSMEDLYAQLQERGQGTPTELHSGDLDLQFVHKEAFGPDVEAYRVKRTWQGTGGGTAHLPMPLGVPITWTRNADRVAASDTAFLTWVHLEADLAPGHEFRVQLSGGLASGNFLNSRVWNHRTYSVLGEARENCLESFYVLDMGVQQVTDEWGNVTGYFHAYGYGVVIYAPGIGPVYCLERVLADPGSATESEGILAGHGVRDVVPDLPATVLDIWGSFGTAPGEFSTPLGIAQDTTGAVHVVDTGNGRVQKFSEDGTFLTAWGQFGCTSDLDGYMAAPRQIAVDRSGNLMVTDSALMCGVLLVHVFDPLGTQLAQHRVWVGQGPNFTGGLVARADSITVIVQNSIVRYSDQFAFGGRWGGRGSAPGEFVQPYAIATGNDGSFFVTDYSLNRVTKLDASGGFVTMWGAAGSDEGQFDGPRGIATDASGLVYVVDRGNNRIQVFDSSGQFVTVLGPNLSVGGQLLLPLGVAITPQGDLLVTDSGNHRIVKLAGVVQDGGARATGAESVQERNRRGP